MADPQLFAQLFPGDGQADATEMFWISQNRKLVEKTPLDRTSRDPTPTDDGEDDRDGEGVHPVAPFGRRERLQLKFGDADLMPKDPTEGWQFGCSTTACDVLLAHPQTPVISRQHFSICITDSFRIQLHQQTRHATRITYCKHNAEDKVFCPKLGDRPYLCSAPWEPHQWDFVKISVGRTCHPTEFLLLFPNHNAEAPDEYIGHIKEVLRTRSSDPQAGLVASE